MTDVDGRVSWPLDRYLVEGPRSTDWLAPGVLKHHRTLATYLAALRGAGFALDDLCEWGPTAAQIDEVPEWARELERPQFLLVATHRR